MMETTRRSVIENTMRRPVVIFSALACLAALCAAAVYFARPDLLASLSAKGDTPAAQNSAATAKTLPDEDKAFYAELDAIAAKGNAAAVTAHIQKNTREKPRLLAVSLDWARDNSVGQQDLQKLNAYYYMLYSDLAFMASQAFKISGMDAEHKDMVRTSFASLLAFDLLAATDALRCKDTSAREVRGHLVKPRYALLEDAFDYLAPEDTYRLFLTVSRAENAMAARAPNKELCADGAIGKMALLNDPGTRRIDVDSPDMPGVKRTVLVPASDFKFTPEYVTDTEWQEARTRMRAAVHESWIQRQMNHNVRKSQGAPAPADGTNGTTP
ncbi:MAG TPA: hypothetical protein PLW48_00515 [Alphaproteobacteria bacterium]|nr:hypothetical protein [Alphaproteobacteria bacterium]